MVALDVSTLVGSFRPPMAVSPRAKAVRDQDKAKMRAVGTRLRRLRALRGLAIEDVAKDSGVRTAALYSYEGGGRVPGVFAALRLASYYGISVEGLITGTGVDDVLDREEAARTEAQRANKQE